VPDEDKPFTPPIVATDVAPPLRRSNYPEPFFSRMALRQRRHLGSKFGLKKFAVNFTVIAPGGETALMHRHSKQEEFVYILSGMPTLVTDRGEFAMAPGMCIGFPASGTAHHLVNRTSRDVQILEIGDREAGDSADYPEDDLAARQEQAGSWLFFHKDGRSY
jgi:uncharacterized cupin superfamily protein